MKKTNIFLYFIIAATALFSCTDKASDTTKKFTVDFDHPKTLEINDDDIITLEANDSSLLFDICNLLTVNGKMAIHSRNTMKVFDSDGHYIRNIGAEGHSQNEYQTISNVFSDGNDVCIYDFMSTAILRYDIDGKLKSRISFRDLLPSGAEMPNHLYKSKNGYVAVNSYGGEGRKVACLSILGNDFKTSKKMDGKYLANGLFFPDDIAFKGDDILYWQPLCDTLFTVRDETVKPYRIFDLGENAFPEDIARQDAYKRMDYANKKHKDGEPFAGMIRYYSPYKDNMFFVCVAPAGNVVVCKYDDSSDTVKTFKCKFTNQSMELQSFLKIIGDNLYLAALDKDKSSANPYIIKLSVDKLL